MTGDTQETSKYQIPFILVKSMIKNRIKSTFQTNFISINFLIANANYFVQVHHKILRLRSTDLTNYIVSVEQLTVHDVRKKRSHFQRWAELGNLFGWIFVNGRTSNSFWCCFNFVDLLHQATNRTKSNFVIVHRTYRSQRFMCLALICMFLWINLRIYTLFYAILSFIWTAFIMIHFNTIPYHRLQLEIIEF